MNINIFEQSGYLVIFGFRVFFFRNIIDFRIRYLKIFQLGQMNFSSFLVVDFFYFIGRGNERKREEKNGRKN